MNIGDNHYNINQSNANTGITGTGANFGQVSGAGAGISLSGNSQITQISEGQMFRGRILDITNDQVNIIMDGNKTLLAHLGEAVNLNIGDLITFIVKENNGANVVIKPFIEQADVTKDNAIFNVLNQNSFSPTEKNYRIAETLMNNGMPVDRNGMQKIMQQSYKYPEVSIDTLVALSKLGISVNEANIRQYEAYVSNSHQITQDIMNLSRAVSDFSFEQIMAMDDSSDIIEFNSSMLEVLSDGDDFSISFDDLKVAITDADIINEGRLKNTDFSLHDRTAGNAKAALINDILASLAERLSVDKKSLEHVFSGLMDMGFDYNTLKTIAGNSDDAIQLLNNINIIIKNGNQFVSEYNAMDIRELMASDGYREIIESAVKGKLTVKCENMDKPEELDLLYDRMYGKANRILEAFSDSNSPAGRQMSDSARGMQERLDFMQNLNQMYTYAQIPVKIAGNDMNSELFVYMNKRSVRDAKEDVSALLHLDMEHLGPTDVHVSLYGTSVHTRFYVEDEESARIIDEHMTMLERAINDNGYSLTNEVITRESSVETTGNMVVDEMLGKDLEQSVKRYSFDVRM